MNSNVLNLLVVDDDDVDREKIRRMLKVVDLETSIEEASSVEESVTVIENGHFDCIIIDYRLGKEDGLALLDKIRNSLAKKCAVILVTGLGDEEIAAKAMRLGASDYIVKKNLKPAQLLTAILNAVHKAEMEKKIYDLAHYDSLTGLVTRHLLIDRLQQAILTNKRQSNLSAIAYIDLDKFKPINDTYGHEAGDYVLVEIAKKLRKTLRTSDTIARIGGDEFVLLLMNIDTHQKCKELLKKVLLILQIPIQLPNSTFVRISASIGVSQINGSTMNADSILRQADQTMYQAKNSGRNKILFFDPEEEQKLNQHRKLIQELELALESNQFQLFYQPKIDINASKFIGVEALIRWNHPERGMLTPNHFLSAFESSVVGVKIGAWVIKEALSQCSAWSKEGLDIAISINISPIHIQSNHFIRSIQENLLDNPKVKPELIELEVLETISIKDIEFAEEILIKCKNLGVKVALDDFGTGYSSLSYLKKLPLDTLKIDKSFIKNLETDTSDESIVKSIIALSKAFNYQLVGEGIETLKQLEKFQSIGGTIMQGFYIAKPMASNQLIPWLEKQHHLN